MSQKGPFNTDHDFIDGILTDNNEAITVLYKEYYPLIQRYVEMNNGITDDAKDIYQDAVVVLVRNIRRGIFRGESTIKTYLYSISRRLWLKELQKRGRKAEKLREASDYLNEDDYNHEETEEYQENMQKMSAALSELGDPCSTILTEYYIEKKGMQEIAEKMGYTNANNAKNQKYKCLQRLKKAFFKK